MQIEKFCLIDLIVLVGPLQNFWWFQTSKIIESQDSKQKIIIFYVVQSLYIHVYKLFGNENIANNHTHQFIQDIKWNSPNLLKRKLYWDSLGDFSSML